MGSAALTLKDIRYLAPIVVPTPSSPNPSSSSSGIERDHSDKSSISTYSPTVSSISDDTPSDTKLYLNNNVEHLEEKTLVPIIHNRKPKLISESSGGECVKFIGIPDKDSICSVSSFEVNSYAEDIEDKPKIPDGGWGWIVVLSSLILSMIADGVSFSFGLLYIEFLATFQESKSKTSVIGSLFLSVPLMSGPIMSALVDKYGCRKMTIAGGLISCTGFILASISNSIEMLSLTFGIIAGLGLGLSYVTAVVSIAYWFDKKRTLAVGLGACGTGIGTFIYAPMTQYFIDEYGWRGTILLLAGSFLNMCVCGAVMREPEWWKLEQKRQTAFSNKSIRAASSCGSESRLSGGGESTFPGIEELRTLMKSGETPEYILTTLATSIATAERFGEASGTENRVEYNSVVNLPTFVKQSEKVPMEVLELLSSNKKLYNVILENYPSLLMCRSCSENKLNKLPADKSVARVPVTMSLKLKASMKPSKIKDNQMTSVDSADVPKIKSPVKSQEPWIKQQFCSNQNYLKDIRIHRNSFVYRGAMMNISKYHLRASSCPNIYRNSMIHIDDENDKWYGQALEMFKNMFDFKMFLEFHFLLLSLGTMLLFIWFIVPYFCLAEYMTRNGYTEDDGALQLSIIGATNAIGMIILGWAGDQPWMNVTKSYAVSLLICGFATMLYPFVVHSIELLMITSAIFGLTFAGNFSFTPVILVELIPLERFTIAYGLILMCQGIGNLLGPPIAGMIFDMTQSWEISFYAAGVFIMLSGVLIAIIPVTKNFRIWGSAPLEKDLEKLSQLSQKDSISIS